jgi:hypothetical protein
MEAPPGLSQLAGLFTARRITPAARDCLTGNGRFGIIFANRKATIVATGVDGDE